MIKQLTRTISADKNIDSPFLNKLGIQAFRTMMARVLYNVVPVRPDPSVKEIFQALQHDGYALWPNFLPADDFQRLEKEAHAFIEGNNSTIHSRVDGANTFKYARVNEAGANVLPESTKFSQHPAIRAILEAAVKKKLGNLYCQYEYLLQGTHPGNTDPQADLHSDYFSNTYKAWLFLTDVELENGPFAFVKGSQLLTPARLRWIHKESCETNGGSRRITDEEMKESGLKETVVTLKKNTLVAVNTHGFHRRLVGKPGQKRLSIGFSARVSPFLAYLLPWT